MAGKTLADHARAYRTRKAERIARMEAALREIADLPYADHDLMREIASIALGKESSKMKPQGFDQRLAIKALLIAAPGHQGGHSDSGHAIAEALCIPFPLTMPNLRSAAIDCGFHPYTLWPWLDDLENGE